MEKKFAKLTDGLYRLLEFFPEGDPLKNRAKDKALLILENLNSINQMEGWTSFQNEKVKTNILEDKDTLLGYLWIAKSQGWLNSTNYLIVVGEYKNIAKQLKPLHVELAQHLPDLDQQQVKTVRRPENVLDIHTAQEPPEEKNPDRQEKIIEYLAKNQRAQVMDLQTVLPNVTKRTIRRDLDELLSQGKIERMGEFNEVFYKLKA